MSVDLVAVALVVDDDGEIAEGFVVDVAHEVLFEGVFVDVGFFVCEDEVVEVIEPVFAVVASENVEAFFHDDSNVAKSACWALASNV